MPLLLRLLTVVVALLLSPPSAGGHSWYPPECCGLLDCALVTRVDPVAYPMRVTTKWGTKTVDANTMIFDSKDAQMHACIAYERLLCIFLPPGQ